MHKSLLDKLSLQYEKEEYTTIINSIDTGVEFRGTNLWILIFAIFVASLGLNVNSTAVIIGAMLISPLMGPIMGIGLSMGINDLTLLRKSSINFLIATVVALITSTIYFSISPLDEAHSEILARTSPTIYDVLIALFGGFAGIVATSSKLKGNVIPGVAIATALMPPLCTAGYGLATFQFTYFFGAFYLFLINTVFIALATFIVVSILHFPHKHLQNKRAELIAKRIIGIVVLVTLLPSIYFGYAMIQQNRFIKNANAFINQEVHFPNDYLLNKKIDAKTKTIALVFGGTKIASESIEDLKSKMPKYQLTNTKLSINQGFSYLSNNKAPDLEDPLSERIDNKEKMISALSLQIDSINNLQKINTQIYAELKIQIPFIYKAILQPVYTISDDTTTRSFLVMLSTTKRIPNEEKNKIEQWLQLRLHEPIINLIIQYDNGNYSSIK